jgi:hypothetical protein
LLSNTCEPSGVVFLKFNSKHKKEEEKKKKKRKKRRRKKVRKRNFSRYSTAPTLVY